MFKENKYYGEVFLQSDEANKCFCLLELIDDKVYITTNLTIKNTASLIPIIYGEFTSLGHLTFVNCLIRNSSTGMIETLTYQPKYTFVSGHHPIDPIGLKIKHFQIDNSAIVNWIRGMHLYNSIEQKLEKQEDIKLSTNINENLNITVTKSTTHTSNQEFFRMDNVGYVTFKSTIEVSILEAIELYNTFQKLFYFIYGKSAQFKSFSFQCLGCGYWASLYYKNDYTKNNISSYINIDYWKIKDEFSNIIKHWFTNKDVAYCSDIIIENLLSIKTSHSRRFTNSYAAFEAFSSIFGNKHKNPSAEKYFFEHKDLLIEITNIPEKDIKGYIKKIVRNRDYLVHRNNTKNNIFSQFELLYISLLLDYIVGIGLMKQMEVSNKIIQLIISKAKSTFQDMQAVNKILNQDLLYEKKE
ncbi:ApeA N-terminal domain 1-containing protein [Lutibacter flavus]|uniref:Uncharacterized protein n=1 Tax=Lutibacter flavus TaxID=691689 RepID=A0A238YD25_9FLAO|nr:HEPN domain-containing protein [Lutibacter flavus]SNR69115.1 hypothetical protein SAMN04488111_2495 [Lutibacter flavus]